MAVGYLAAFLGGLFTLISPCSALLLPAFFAYAFDGPARLLARTTVFYAGLVVTLVPLGMGAAQASRLVYGHQTAVAITAGLLLVAFGLLQLLGRGFTFGPVNRLRARIRGTSGPAVFALGATTGLAGFCAGPVLGAVLTVAAASGQAVRGGALLAVYALGMAAPLFALAALWDRLRIGERRLLRGRGRTFGPVTVHSTAALSGLVFIALGGLFLANHGEGGLVALFTAPSLGGWERRAEGWATAAQAHVPDLALLAVVAVAIVAVTVWRVRRGGPPGAASALEAQVAAEESGLDVQDRGGGR
ncbi:MAG TPA: cytochrome c biogenesis CcdA family protein [Streptosporangiaceae bacterium]|jgi:cytochrome c biogenesis protein CcdA